MGRWLEVRALQDRAENLGYEVTANIDTNCQFGPKIWFEAKRGEDRILLAWHHESTAIPRIDLWVTEQEIKAPVL